MTDSSGTKHRWTLPVGKVSPTVWANQQNSAKAVLPKQFSELVQKTKHPFVQVITDVISPQAVYMDGKVILVGDALCGLRPHTAASTSQAAMHALGLEDVMSGWMKLSDWEKKMEEWAEWMSRRGKTMGDRSQFGNHPLADDR
jgi:2-polyprenyl-6-methoxyphenol hydroxylase-like FAD-dependent oxidoreductase